MTTMKKLGFLFAALALVFTAGCEPQEILEPTDPEDVQGGRARFEIRVTIDPETKATMVDKKLSFAKDDRIAILATKDAVTDIYQLVATSVEGNVVVFSEDTSMPIPEGATIGEYAYYPYDLIVPNGSTSIDPLEICWPSMYYGQGVSVPMMAKIDIVNQTAVFKHLGAMLKVNLVNVPANNEWLEFKTSQKFVGHYTVNPATWSLTLIDDQWNDDCEVLEAKASGLYYIPIPAGTYANFQLGMMSSDNYGFPVYYNKQRTAILSSAITPVRTNIVNLGDFTYDVDEIAEWWHLSDQNGWSSGYNRYIKTGANTYQITAFNPQGNPWWKLVDAGGNPWRTAAATNWSGTLSLITGTDNTFNRTGADDKTFWVTLSKNGDNWDYNSGNWGNNAATWGSGSSVDLRGDFNNWGEDPIVLSKYSSYDANYTFKYEGFVVSDNDEHEFKFFLNNATWCGGSVSLTDAKPYATAQQGTGDNMKFRLTPGTYNIYLDAATMNFMFVKQPNPATTTTP